MKKIVLLLMTVLSVGLVSCGLRPQVEVTNLKVEMQTNPEGIDVLRPHFSWQITSQKPDLIQKSYQIQVAESPESLQKATNLIWDSGIVTSDQSVYVPYGGKELVSGKPYYWRVLVETNQGKIKWSETAHWSMGLLDSTEWKAQWIGLDSLTNPGETMDKNPRLSARYLRKDFEALKPIKRAMLYICGLGSSKTFINGKTIGDDIFGTMVSWFKTRVYYKTYDVTDLISMNKNTIGVILGSGRYFNLRTNTPEDIYGFPKLIAQLDIEYEDGSHNNILTDDSWKLTTHGPIVANNEYDGEEYDARLEMPGWNDTGFNDSAWQSAKIVSAPGKLCSQPNPGLSIQEEINPKSVKDCGDGRYILDMGQNMVGWLAVKQIPAKKGKPITMRFAETLTPKGDSLYLANLRHAKVTDIYTPAVDTIFSWEPTFVYHGFRFVEITGLDAQPSLDAFVGKVIYDKMETTGSFTSSNDIVNQIFKNAYWGIRGNYRGMPTDCPQRDERQGWLGDRATGCYGESFIFGNNLLYSKWLQDIEDCQHDDGVISDVSPNFWSVYNDDITWPSAFFYGCDMLYKRFGDTSAIIKHYPAMKKFIEHNVSTNMKDYIMTKDEYGDWCMPPESQELIHSKDPSRVTDGAILSTTVFYDLLNKMSVYAHISGNDADVQGYKDLAAKIKDAYNKKFFHSDSSFYGNNTVTANILSLHLGLVPQGQESKVFENIVNKTEKDFGGHVSCGVLGIQHLMRALTENGEVDLAYRILTNDTYPSWGYMAKKGATTIWELWNGDTADPSMNSGNHVMLLGDLIIWYFEDMAGIKNASDAVGFKKIFMEPVFPKGLTSVKASYNSVYGTISSEWSLKNGAFSWFVTIPGNTTAIIRIPSAYKVDKSLKPGIHKVSDVGNFTQFEVGSGTYHFASK